MLTDENGYLVAAAAAFTGRQSDGVLRSIYSRNYLESSLWSYGEDDCLATVLAGISPEQVYAIGVAHYRLVYTADPSLTSGAGYTGDKALALAAVEVVEGQERALHRSRRRTKPK